MIEKLTPLANVLPIFIGTLEKADVRNSYISDEAVNEIIKNSSDSESVSKSKEESSENDLDSKHSSSTFLSDSSTYSENPNSSDWSLEDSYISTKRYTDD